MATYVLTLGGVTKTWRAGTLNMEQSCNGAIGTLSCDVMSAAGTYRPALDAEVILTENGTPIFGGTIQSTRERWLGDKSWTGIVTTISAQDYNALPLKRVVNGTIPAGNTDDWLQWIVDNILSDDGVTLSGSQPTGVAMEQVTYVDAPLPEVLATIYRLAGFDGNIDASKVLKADVPGAVPSPYNIAANDGNVIGDPEVETVRSDTYANRVIVRFGTGTKEADQSFVADGVATSWTTDLPAVPAYVYLVNTVIYNGASVPMGPYQPGNPASLYGLQFDPESHTIYQRSGDAPLSASDTLDIHFVAQYPFRAVANDTGEQTAHGTWEAVEGAPDIFDFATATDLAAAILAERLGSLQRIVYDTRQIGILPQMSQTIVLPKRNLNGTFLVTDVSARDEIDNSIARTVTAVGGSYLKPGWQKTYQDWMGGGAAVASAGESSSDPGGSSTTPHSTLTTWGNDPSGPSDGDLALYSDAPLIKQYDSAAWHAFGPIWPLTPFVDSGFSWGNQGSATKNVGNGIIYMTAPAQTGYSIRRYMESAPSTPYTVTALFTFALHSIGTPVAGLCFRESATGKLMIWSPSATAASPALFYFTSDTVLNNTLVARNQGYQWPIWLRIENDGTNIVFWQSIDGVNWFSQYSEVKGAHFTTGPNEIGLALSTAGNTSQFCAMACYSYKKA